MNTASRNHGRLRPRPGVRADADAGRARVRADDVRRAADHRLHGLDVRQREARICGGAGAPAQHAGRIDPAAVTAQSTQSESDRPAVDARGEVVTKTTITSDALQSSNSQNTYDAIKNIPGVVQTDTARRRDHR